MNRNPESWFKIYDDLEHTKLLYLLKNNVVKGRALLHDKVNSPLGEIKIMDRIYSADADVLAMFVQYAVRNGYLRKESQSLGCRTYIYPWSEESVELYEMWIECDDLRRAYDKVPYIDTFSHYYIVDGEHLLSSSDSYRDLYPETTLRNTNGTDSECMIAEPEFICASCGDGMDEDDGVYVGGVGRICDSCAEGYYYCECCGEHIHVDNVTFVNDTAYCEYHANQWFTVCEDCGEYISRDYAIHVEDHGYVCDGCRLTSRYFECGECGGWFKARPGNETNDGAVCDSCFDMYEECKECRIHFHEDDLVDGYCKKCHEQVAEVEV